MQEECLICKSALEYLKEDVLMECEFCHKSKMSKTRCVNGHYVCDDCHMKGLDRLIAICLEEKSDNPFVVIDRLMNEDFCHMHGPEHHILVGSSLLTAYKNSGGDIDLPDCLKEMIARGKQVPGGVCGFWGACGAGISSGIFISIITKSTPLSEEEFKLSNLMTSKSLASIANHGGPRCCKRDSYLAILNAVDFVRENLNIVMKKSDVVCKFHQYNSQCIKEKCPFYSC
jgi:hypothetical protein